MSEQSLTPEVPQVPTAESLIAQVNWDEPEPTAGEDEQVGATAAADEQAPEDVTQQSDADEGERELARSRGWVDEKDYRGKAKWVDAAAYNARYETITPHVLRESKKLREELRAEREERQRMQAEMADLRKHYEEQKEAAQTIQFQTLMAQKAQAEQDGDFQTANKIGDQLLDLKLERKVALPKQPQQQRIDPAVQRTLEDFANDNPIFKDQQAQVYLAVAAQQLAQAGTALRGRDLLDEAGQLAQQLFPNKFKQPVRRPAMAEMNGAPSRANGATRSWADLKPEVAKQQEDFIRSTPALAKQDAKKVRASILADLPREAFRR